MAKSTPPAAPGDRRDVADEPQKPRRAQSHWDEQQRASVGRKTPPKGMAVPTFVAEEITGTYEGEELERERARRPTPMRLAHLEKKHDKLDGKVDVIATTVGDVKATVGELKGQLTGQDAVLEIIRGQLTNIAQREHTVFMTRLETDKAVSLDQVDARKTKREWLTLGMKIIVSLAGIFAFIVEAGRC